MRKIALALLALVTLVVPAFAGPPCRTDVGGLCGSDYDGWMQTWRRSNPGKIIQPVSSGGYGLMPNGQQFYPNQGGYNGQNMAIGYGGVQGGYMGNGRGRVLGGLTNIVRTFITMTHTHTLHTQAQSRQVSAAPMRAVVSAQRPRLVSAEVTPAQRTLLYSIYK